MKLFLICVLIFVTFSICDAKVYLHENKEGRFTGELENVSLANVADFFKKDHGIEFKGDTSLLQIEINMTCDNLSFEEVLKRMLSKMNYVISYDTQGKTTEVKLLSMKNKNKTESSIPAYAATPKTQASPADHGPGPEANATNEFVQDEVNSFKPVKMAPQEEEINNETKDDITSFKIVPNAPPPGK